MRKTNRLLGFLKRLYAKISPRFFLESRFAERFQEKLDLSRSESLGGFNQKILWLILACRDPLVAACADKYRVRGYVESVGLKHILAKLYGVYRVASEIDWDALPQKFAIKCNHGCGYNIICANKDALDTKEASAKLNMWLREDFGRKFYEPQYSKIKPLIVCEEYMETEAGLLPVDYKVYCFNGVPKAVLYCFERQSGLRLEWYDTEWNPLEVGLIPNGRHAGKPACLDEMLEYAARLAMPFLFVRVDFYVKDGRPFFGEMTFTPAYGMAEYYSPEGNAYLGSLLKLPPKGMRLKNVTTYLNK